MKVEEQDAIFAGQKESSLYQIIQTMKTEENAENNSQNKAEDRLHVI